MAVISYLFMCIVYLPRLIMRRNVKSLKILTIVFVMQNFVCILASDALPSAICQLLILYKEIPLYGGVVYYCLVEQSGKIKKNVGTIALTIIVFAFYMLRGNASVMTKLISFRQLMTPLILMLYGSTLRLSRKDFEEYIKFFVNVCVMLSLFGFAERFALGDAMWKAIHIEKYMGNKGFSKWVYSTGLPGDFYSADLYSLLGFSLRRLAGLAADPLLTGHFLAIGLVILLFYRVYPSYKQVVCALVISAAILLTLGKGAILIVGIAYLYKLSKKNKVYLLILLPIAIGALYFIISRNMFDTVARHLGGLTSSFSPEAFIGHGLGMSGNYANLYEGSSVTSGESYVGAIIGQTGFVGLIACVSVYYCWGKKLLRINRHPLSYAVLAYILGALIEAFMSESAINFIGSGMAFVLFGLLSENKIYGGTAS